MVDNFAVEYPPDAFSLVSTTWTHALNVASYAAEPLGAKIYSWCLLENKPLGVDVDSVEILQPVVARGKGKKTSRRKRAHGC